MLSIYSEIKQSIDSNLTTVSFSYLITHYPISPQKVLKESGPKVSKGNMLENMAVHQRERDKAYCDGLPMYKGTYLMGDINLPACVSNSAVTPDHFWFYK